MRTILWNKIKQIASKQKEIARNHTTFNTHIWAYLENIPIPPFTTAFGRNTTKQIFIPTIDHLVDNNRTRMEHILLLETTIGSKYLTIGSVRLGCKLIIEDNQAQASIDRWVKGDQGFPFRSQRSGNGMSVGFGQNAYVKIGINTPRTIGIPCPHITRTRLINCDIFNLVIRVSPWHVKMKNES